MKKLLLLIALAIATSFAASATDWVAKAVVHQFRTQSDPVSAFTLAWTTYGQVRQLDMQAQFTSRPWLRTLTVTVNLTMGLGQQVTVYYIQPGAVAIGAGVLAVYDPNGVVAVDSYSVSLVRYYS